MAGGSGLDATGRRAWDFGPGGNGRVSDHPHAGPFPLSAVTPSPPTNQPRPVLKRGSPSLQRKMTYLCGTVAAATVAILAAFMLQFQGRAIKDDLARTAETIDRGVADRRHHGRAGGRLRRGHRRDETADPRKSARFAISCSAAPMGSAFVVERPQRWREKTSGTRLAARAETGGGRLTRTALSDARVFHASERVRRRDSRGGGCTSGWPSNITRPRCAASGR